MRLIQEQSRVFQLPYVTYLIGLTFDKIVIWKQQIVSPRIICHADSPFEKHYYL